MKIIIRTGQVTERYSYFLFKEFAHQRNRFTEAVLEKTYLKKNVKKKKKKHPLTSIKLHVDA